MSRLLVSGAVLGVFVVVSVSPAVAAVELEQRFQNLDIPTEQELQSRYGTYGGQPTGINPDRFKYLAQEMVSDETSRLQAGQAGRTSGSVVGFKVPTSVASKGWLFLKMVPVVGAAFSAMDFWALGQWIGRSAAGNEGSQSPGGTFRYEPSVGTYGAIYFPPRTHIPGHAAINRECWSSGMNIYDYANRTYWMQQGAPDFQLFTCNGGSGQVISSSAARAGAVAYNSGDPNLAMVLTNEVYRIWENKIHLSGDGYSGISWEPRVVAEFTPKAVNSQGKIEALQALDATGASQRFLPPGSAVGSPGLRGQPEPLTETAPEPGVVIFLVDNSNNVTVVTEPPPDVEPEPEPTTSPSPAPTAEPSATPAVVIAPPFGGNSPLPPRNIDQDDEDNEEPDADLTCEHWLAYILRATKGKFPFDFFGSMMDAGEETELKYIAFEGQTYEYRPYGSSGTVAQSIEREVDLEWTKWIWNAFSIVCFIGFCVSWFFWVL